MLKALLASVMPALRNITAELHSKIHQHAEF
jgi:hypothetical protein